MELGSAGSMVAARAAWETSCASVARRELRRFLFAVERDALTVVDGPPLVAAAGDFSWMRVAGLWGQLAHALVEHLARLRGGEDVVAPYDAAQPYAPPAPGDFYLTAAYARLMESPVPALVRDTATAVLSVAAEALWSRRRLVRELGAALSLTRGAALRREGASAGAPSHPFDLPDLTVRGDTWDAMPELLARAEATGAFNSWALGQMSRAGFTRKRWVTRHDDRVRPTHRAAEGQTVPLASEFVVGGFVLAYPADPAGPAQETAGCRCSIVGVR